jgi:hypothetical protein
MHCHHLQGRSLPHVLVCRYQRLGKIYCHHYINVSKKKLSPSSKFKTEARGLRSSGNVVIYLQVCMALHSSQKNSDILTALRTSCYTHQVLQKYTCMVGTLSNEPFFKKVKINGSKFLYESQTKLSCLSHPVDYSCRKNTWTHMKATWQY